MKILIIGPAWVGDMVMSQSLYRTLKHQHPHAQLDVMAPKWCLPLLSRMPEVDQAIEMPLGHGDLALKTRYRLGLELRAEQYDAAYVLPNSAKSALIPFFAKIPKRIGWKGEMRYGLLNDVRTNKQSFQYMVERYVALAHPKWNMVNSGSLPGLEMLPWPKLMSDADAQRGLMLKLGLTHQRPIVGICPGAEFGPAKQWPAEHYASLTKQLSLQGYQVWIFGSPKDQDVAKQIESQLPDEARGAVFNLAGQTSLSEAIDLLALCQTVVSNDSGLMHIAAAVGCQVVGVYGSTSPEYTPPLSDSVSIVHTDIVCRPCFKRKCPLKHLKCLKDLMPEQVLMHIPAPAKPQL